MDELVEWYGQQLDEDERTARAAGGASWEELPVSGWVHTTPLPTSEWQPPGYDHHVAAAPLAEDRAHIIRHDPARVLREIDAKRQMLAAYEDARRKCAEIGNEHWGAAGPSGDPSAVERWKEHDAIAEALKPHLLNQAAAYADRPGYKESWRP